MLLQIVILTVLLFPWTVVDSAEDAATAMVHNVSATTKIHNTTKDTTGQSIPIVLSDEHNEHNVTISEEKRLLRFLMHRYKLVGKSGRPVVNSSEPVKVKFGLGLTQMKLDEKESILLTSMWTRYLWRDQYMVWDSMEYGGIQTVILESKYLWLPDIMLYNSADTEVMLRDTNVVISSDGTISWYPHRSFRSTCSMSLQDFPFDRQECHMWFGSWTYPVSQLNLEIGGNGLDISTFMADDKDVSEWNIVEHTTDRILKPDGNNDYFAVFTIELHMERKVTFTTHILTLPCVFLASLTLVVFCLPADSADRTGLAMSLFAGFLLLLLILVGTAPRTYSSVPKIGIYYCFNMVLVILSIFLSSLVVNVHMAGESKKQVPAWLTLITIQFIWKAFCLTWRCKKKDEKRTQINTKANEKELMVVENDQDTPCNVFHDSSDQLNAISNPCSSNRNETHLNSMYSCQANAALQMCYTLSGQLGEVKMIMEQMMNRKVKKDTENEEAKQNADEWKMVAKCLDRLFFLIYFVSIVFSLLYLFPRPTN